MKKKVFFRFFAVTLLSVALMFIFGIVAVNVNAKEMMRERLQEETELVCSIVKEREDFESLSRYENDDAFRITVLDLGGDVLFESDTRAPLENHIDREEIKDALAGTPKTVERYSETFDCNMTYYAMKTALADGEEIVLRLAIKNSRLNSYLGVAIPILVAVLIVSLVASLLISKLLSDKVSGKIVEIGESLKSLNSGDYEPIKTNSSEPEFYSVLNEINELNANTHTQIQKIQEERKRLNAVLENVSQGIVALDEEKRIVFANKSAAKIFDSAELLTGKDFIYLIDDLSLCEKITRHAGENYASDYVYKGKDLSVVIRKIVDDGFTYDVSSIVIITDVTKEKAMQKQKSDFFANASHELKTPVTVMQGLSEVLLSKDSLDEGSKKQVERIHKESVRLASLVSDMLKLSKLERGEERDIFAEDVNLREICEEAVQELLFEANAKNISISICGEATIRADAKKIFEIAENLCSNAVHYNKENGRISIEISKSDDGVTLKVADSGIGIEKSKIPRLCERFYRVDKSRSEKTGGTGLGLAIVKHVCALYDAELSIESDLGVGTTVTVRFSK